MHIDAAPAQLDVDEREPPVARHGHVGPGGGIGQGVEEHVVLRPRRAQVMPEHMSVVVASRRVTRVRERGAVGRPAHRCGPRVRDLVGEVLARLDVDDAQRRALVAGACPARSSPSCGPAGFVHGPAPATRRSGSGDRRRPGDPAAGPTSSAGSTSPSRHVAIGQGRQPDRSCQIGLRCRIAKHDVVRDRGASDPRARVSNSEAC